MKQLWINIATTSIGQRLLWHDLLDVLGAMAPDEQDWIDNTLPHEERKHLEKPLLQPNQFCKTCWYWLDLITNSGD